MICRRFPRGRLHLLGAIAPIVLTFGSTTEADEAKTTQCNATVCAKCSRHTVPIFVPTPCIEALRGITSTTLRLSPKSLITSNIEKSWAMLLLACK